MSVKWRRLNRRRSVLRRRWYASDTVVALRISSAGANGYWQCLSSQIWLPIARILSRRLFERNDLLTPPNESPRLLIISSAEALSVAYEVATQLERVALPTVWAHGTFFAGQYTLEALVNAVGQSVFAVAIAQPDDLVESRQLSQPTVRDNA